MVVIEENDFKITQAADNSVFWDLELKQKIKSKGKPIREEFKESGFGMPLTTCLNKVALFRLANKQEIYDLKTFVKEYSTELKNINNLIKGYEKF